MGRCPCAASCSVERDSKLEVMRILVIEDEVKLAAHLSRALEHDGHEVRVVHDGKVALVEAPGHGLGLSIARELARAHGGDLNLTRSRADWTEFCLRLSTSSVHLQTERPPPATGNAIGRSPRPP